ncbi:molybdopterin dinucleotide-binding protein [Methanomicrobium antiquum]|uniref:Molybdopterin dinucleotide-binding protein n=1 Tax=Methanomicrobium antiquum TaxID=487686 RepID=A0AAF0FW54_9EURY|nr:molybdopterin dinucleotide binding domain-containing protein [Methanomicrobium antiquum]WFN37040.1 molybdopterin dinucleotide-binding protein [Methanomicrobium antiquum]
MKFEMITGRTIRQGEFVEHKLSAEYSKETSSCHINPVDMMILGISNDDNVLLKSTHDEIVMSAVEDSNIKRGTIFVPYGPYCNKIIPYETHGTGMPDYKSSVVEITHTDKQISPVFDLFREIGGQEI